MFMIFRMDFVAYNSLQGYQTNTELLMGKLSNSSEVIDWRGFNQSLTFEEIKSHVFDVNYQDFEERESELCV